MAYIRLRGTHAISRTFHATFPTWWIWILISMVSLVQLLGLKIMIFFDLNEGHKNIFFHANALFPRFRRRNRFPVSWSEYVCMLAWKKQEIWSRKICSTKGLAIFVIQITSYYYYMSYQELGRCKVAQILPPGARFHQCNIGHTL